LVDTNLLLIFVEDKNTLTMAIRKTTTPAPKLNVQHNYITLKLPTGNFTTSYGGAKCSGQLVKMKGAFEALDKYVQTAANTFVTGDLVSFTDGTFAKKYPGKFVVSSTKGKYTYIKVINKRTGLTENVGFASTELKKS
jgi:hypothetical protein